MQLSCLVCIVNVLSTVTVVSRYDNYCLSLDCNVLKNFRPVSNLSYISKIIEKVIASRLMDHMTANITC